MTLKELHAEVMLAHDVVQWVHWHVTGPDYWGVHKGMTEPIYERLQDERDDLAELARQHGEDAAVPGVLNSQSVVWDAGGFSAREAVWQTGEALDRLTGAVNAAAQEYLDDIGIQNHLGQLYEDLTKWLDYHLRFYIEGAEG